MLADLVTRDPLVLVVEGEQEEQEDEDAATDGAVGDLSGLRRRRGGLRLGLTDRRGRGGRARVDRGRRGLLDLDPDAGVRTRRTRLGRRGRSDGGLQPVSLAGDTGELGPETVALAGDDTEVALQTPDEGVLERHQLDTPGVAVVEALVAVGRVHLGLLDGVVDLDAGVGDALRELLDRHLPEGEDPLLRGLLRDGHRGQGQEDGGEQRAHRHLGELLPNHADTLRGLLEDTVDERALAPVRRRVALTVVGAQEST